MDRKLPLRPTRLERAFVSPSPKSAPVPLVNRSGEIEAVLLVGPPAGARFEEVIHLYWHPDGQNVTPLNDNGPGRRAGAAESAWCAG
jgi:hypothetical protein